MLERQTFEHEIGGRKLVIATGKVAEQAAAAITVHYGDTLVLVTVCASAEPKENIDFLPLTVDYEERLYAAGKIPGGFIRREGRPSQEATLASRLTDRPFRRPGERPRYSGSYRRFRRPLYVRGTVRGSGGGRTYRPYRRQICG